MNLKEMAEIFTSKRVYHVDHAGAAGFEQEAYTAGAQAVIDKIVLSLKKIANHEETIIMDNNFSTDCAEADAFRECVIISRELLKELE